MTDHNVESFVNAYITCMLWSSTDSNGDPLDSGDHPLSIEAKRVIRDDCESFLFAGQNLLADLPSWYGHGEGGSFSQVGHDFWLTRNGHGAGFWDRGLDDLGDRLTALSKTYAPLDPYIGDDGYIYF